jgi:hypothetical protein
MYEQPKLPLLGDPIIDEARREQLRRRDEARAALPPIAPRIDFEAVEATLGNTGLGHHVAVEPVRDPTPTGIYFARRANNGPRRELTRIPSDSPLDTFVKWRKGR